MYIKVVYYNKKMKKKILLVAIALGIVILLGNL